MANKQLSFMEQLFPCASGVCKSGGTVAYKVMVTYYPHGKANPKAWTDVSLFCEECTERIRRAMAENPIVKEYNDIKIEKL